MSYTERNTILKKILEEILGGVGDMGADIVAEVGEQIEEKIGKDEIPTPKAEPISPTVTPITTQVVEGQPISGDIAEAIPLSFNEEEAIADKQFPTLQERTNSIQSIFTSGTEWFKNLFKRKSKPSKDDLKSILKKLKEKENEELKNLGTFADPKAIIDNLSPNIQKSLNALSPKKQTETEEAIVDTVQNMAKDIQTTVENANTETEAIVNNTDTTDDEKQQELLKTLEDAKRKIKEEEERKIQELKNILTQNLPSPPPTSRRPDEATDMNKFLKSVSDSLQSLQSSDDEAIITQKLKGIDTSPITKAANKAALSVITETAEEADQALDDCKDGEEARCGAEIANAFTNAADIVVQSVTSVFNGVKSGVEEMMNKATQLSKDQQDFIKKFMNNIFQTAQDNYTKQQQQSKLEKLADIAEVATDVEADPTPKNMEILHTAVDSLLSDNLEELIKDADAIQNLLEPPPVGKQTIKDHPPRERKDIAAAAKTATIDQTTEAAETTTETAAIDQTTTAKEPAKPSAILSEIQPRKPGLVSRLFCPKDAKIAPEEIPEDKVTNLVKTAVAITNKLLYKAARPLPPPPPSPSTIKTIASTIKGKISKLSAAEAAAAAKAVIKTAASQFGSNLPTVSMPTMADARRMVFGKPVLAAPKDKLLELIKIAVVTTNGLLYKAPPPPATTVPTITTEPTEATETPEAKTARRMGIKLPAISAPIMAAARRMIFGKPEPKDKLLELIKIAVVTTNGLLRKLPPSPQPSMLKRVGRIVAAPPKAVGRLATAVGTAVYDRMKGKPGTPTIQDYINHSNKIIEELTKQNYLYSKTQRFLNKTTDTAKKALQGVTSRAKKAFGIADTGAPSDAGPDYKVPATIYEIPFETPPNTIVIEEESPKYLFDTTIKNENERKLIENKYKKENEELATKVPKKVTNIQLEEAKMIYINAAGKEVDEKIYEFKVEPQETKPNVKKGEKGAGADGAGADGAVAGVDVSADTPKGGNRPLPTQ